MKFNTKLVGILNYTPDSFSDGGQFFSIDKALQQVKHLINGGADIIDVGGESTRPTYLYTQHGNNTISQTEEWDRLKYILPKIIEIAHNHNVQVSIDTRYAKTAEKAIELNVDYVNDVSTLSDKNMLQVLQNSSVNVVITHSLGIPLIKNNTIPKNLDPINEIIIWAKKYIDKLTNAGIDKNRIIIDPGIGFSKTANQTFYILNNIDRLKVLNQKIYVGHSRKFFLTSYTSNDPTRDNATLAISIFLFQQGIDFIRVHNTHLHSEAFNLLRKMHQTHLNNI
ncbi:dihydropteroate synthase [Ehrlichia chaffeensis str. Heartland]|uniref:Dihydropteroate synthase n=1 Tax=Ehrlichia chaffeensis (strain ATCC CRL-10679 / Arkansas) TaxID=205920 RepID=Q2GH82_EHRCR|nr:dihydropteroate synthase [Ehrlichia chaffeensis]ABD45009.1 dihydropteroate synthase [Ehrlichia chaffeensis str. Arkansas]AHX03490.1 dihydropteroate synthase [Ehrlichia chaffeensis str. Heartland]AHX05790.1 dihydropteroate synthase [Ehrlichia chaffeensis str. Jax]AHX06781.1 dihydropteroate synthase [Ehrlichia chaffeensis str. Liberty]AHX07439.1 dihydropteroate synthase [Ehrlichia chaffeensis str. Osceola]